MFVDTLITFLVVAGIGLVILVAYLRLRDKE